MEKFCPPQLGAGRHRYGPREASYGSWHVPWAQRESPEADKTCARPYPRQPRVRVDPATLRPYDPLMRSCWQKPSTEGSPGYPGTRGSAAHRQRSKHGRRRQPTDCQAGTPEERAVAPRASSGSLPVARRAGSHVTGNAPPARTVWLAWRQAIWLNVAAIGTQSDSSATAPTHSGRRRAHTGKAACYADFRVF